MKSTETKKLPQTARVVPQPKSYLLEKKDNARLPLPLLFNWIMFTHGGDDRVISDEESNLQLDAIEQDPLTTEYYHLLIHATCQYAIAHGGKVKGVYPAFNEDFFFAPLLETAGKARLEANKLKLLYRGEGSATDFLRLFGWYDRQLSDYPFLTITTKGRLLDHVFNLALSDRSLLQANRDTLYCKLTVQ